MIPQTLVLKPDLVIHGLHNGYWSWGRPSFGDLWRDLPEATREIRQDWDISPPELRAKWLTGEKSSFYPYPSADG
jgi:hypothetical protein